MSRHAIFITGAATGIGQATARLFAARGWFVGLYDINEVGVMGLAKELGVDNTCHARLDVTRIDDWRHALEEFSRRAGRLDVLVNNAGVMVSGPLENSALEELHQVMDINFKGVLNGCYLAFPYLIETPRSRIINLCSASALYGQPDLAVYSASKFAVRGLTEALDMEWSGRGIRVMDVLPLFVQTRMVEGILAQSIRTMRVHLTPEDVARVVWKAANHDARGHIVHWTVGIQTRFLYTLAGILPDWLTRLLMRRLTGRG